ncbi:methyl-accepting chemotaxis protein [Aestuariispira insulae]|uniref:Methyl-accepting chemotaxis protein n=1 Tax=Aestuariispira insulae TaxID=1461337 RepID=A0A3D9HWG1_9PROT|nr:methyl-accepting chemotaxis protein [Aestuariispira insulae]RED53838.1 methyl-accepting chemotaxis protein [Aestuariispira insulae]
MLLNRFRLSKKLPLAIVGLVALGTLATALFADYQSKQFLVESSQSKLMALMQSRHKAISDYLGTINSDLEIMAATPNTTEALLAFEGAWDVMEGDRTATLQRLYIEENPHPTGAKEELDFANDGSGYSAVHAQYHPWFRTFLRERGYYDIFLFDLDGNLIYTVFKELDYATNLNSGQWRDTDLGNAFRAAAANPQPGFQAFFDFQPYGPSAGAAASFISTPLFSDGKLAGVLVFQMPIDKINGVMQQTAGMGETGETYLVGSDKLMRSASRFSEESTILKTRVDTDSVSRALSGETGVHVAADYRGEMVFSAFTSLEFMGANWAILAEIDEREVLNPIEQLQIQVALIAVGVLIVTAIAGIFVGRNITSPLSHMTGAMKELASGDLDVRIPAQSREDEIGDMASAMKVFRDNAMEAQNMREAQNREKERLNQETREKMLQMADSLDSEVQEAVSRIEEKTGSVQEVARNMNSVAKNTNSQMTSVNSSAQQATHGVSAVAAAAEEMVASITEITRQAKRSASIAAKAMEEAERTNGTVRELDDASQRIGDVVSLITDIAEQTNLLALNATIEAARAGDAGKGFAVVANEVKSLATQTGKATEEIAQQVSTIQTETSSAVQAIASIGDTISEINKSISMIESSVEQQNVATEEISRNAQETSANTNEVSAIIGDISGETASVGELSDSVRQSIGEIAGRMTDLKQNLTVILRESSAGNRRSSERLKVDMAGKATLADGRVEEFRIHDLSPHGLGLEPPLDIPIGQEFKVTLSGHEMSLDTRVIDQSERRSHVAFVGPQEQQEWVASNVIGRIVQHKTAQQAPLAAD